MGYFNLRLKISLNGKFKYYQITDNIAISLYPSQMNRSADTYFAGSSSRYMSTYLLVENYYVSFIEQAHYKDIGKLTSRALALICEALTK